MLQTFKFQQIWVLVLVLIVSWGAKAARASSPSLREAQAACQDLKNENVLIAFTHNQGQSTWANERDIKTGLYCVEGTAEDMFWALANERYSEGSQRDASRLKRYAKLWDSGRLKVSLYLVHDAQFTGAQAACYGEYIETNGRASITGIYCWTTFAISEGVGHKLKREWGRSGDTLYQAFRTCLRNSRFERRYDGSFLVCDAESAENLLRVFKEGKNAWGDRYALTDKELRDHRGRLASGTASAVYSESKKSQKVIFGEQPTWLGSGMELSDISKCEKYMKGSNAGRTECLFYFGPSSQRVEW